MITEHINNTIIFFIKQMYSNLYSDRDVHADSIQSCYLVIDCKNTGNSTYLLLSYVADDAT